MSARSRAMAWSGWTWPPFSSPPCCWWRPSVHAFPSSRRNWPPTPVETLDRARQVALAEGVRFVYVGNVPGHPGNNMYCPACGRPIIVREGFTVVEYHLNGNACAYCGQTIPGVWWPAGVGEQPAKAPAIQRLNKETQDDL